MDRQNFDWFYDSAAWIKCRNSYMQSQNYVCEICGDVAAICHHRIPITAANINNPDITFNWKNLQAVCQKCHNEIHFTTSPTKDGLAFDKDGNLIEIPPS